MNGIGLHERASALFLELRGIGEPERSAALERGSHGDVALRDEVASLLAHDLDDDPTAAVVLAPSPPGASLTMPERIGPYRIIERLGQGGSGVVFLAEQEQPVRRRVAIKIVPHAAVNPLLAARFEVERRALERTDHAHICRILDAGRTPEGLPYLVMDYVDGIAITSYCRRHELGWRRRIDLMLDVADAVQHAHQRGVIHRDLKPGNILVSEAPDRANPRVLDFGIAKPIEAIDDQTPQTIGFIGTPAYMAPEQAGGRTIDTRADVYALGAVLYELISGQPPFQSSPDAGESLRRILHGVPAPASRVRAEHASEFGRDPIPRAGMTDLDCLLAKSLEKDPSRRYASVGAWADDLRRLLHGQPIAAQPPTRRYRAARFVQRNKALVAAASAVSIALILGVVGLVIGLREAERQRHAATRQFESLQEINTFLTDDLLAAASPDQEGHAITALDLLRRAGRRVDQRFGDRPLIAASIHHVLGTSYTALGSFDDADWHLRKAIELRRSQLGANDRETVHSEIAAASLLLQRGSLNEADAALEALIERSRLILDPNDPALYSALNDLGVARETLDKPRQAVALLQEALTGRLRLLGPRDPLVLTSMTNLANAYDRLGESEKSLKQHLDALRIAESLDDPPMMILIGLCNNVAATYQDLNRDQDAAPYLRRACDLAAQWLEPTHPDTLTLQGNLAGLESELGNHDRAAALFAEVIEARSDLMGPDAYETLVARYGQWNNVWRARRFDEAATGYLALLADMKSALESDHWIIAQTEAALALTLADDGRFAEAHPHAERAVASFTTKYGSEHARTHNARLTLDRVRRELNAISTPDLGEPPAARP